MKKVVVVGFGFMGLSHTINILKNKELQLTAIVDKDQGNIEKKLTEQTGNFSTGNLKPESLSGIKFYSSLDECLSMEDPDACFICVHTDLHYEMAKKALLAGKHVFLEKPVCLDIKQGEELITLANERNLILLVGQVVRFMPAYRKLQQWIISGKFGPLRFLSLSRFAGIPAWGEWTEKQSNFGSSGGALFDLVIHDIDFVQSVLGVPDSIRSEILPGKLSNHDYVSAFWKYNGRDIVVKIEGGLIFHSTFPFHAGFSALFERASILYSTFQPDHISISTNQESNQISAGDANEGFAGEVDYFTTCMEDGVRPLLCTPESALLTIRICYDHLNNKGIR